MGFEIVKLQFFMTKSELIRLFLEAGSFELDARNLDDGKSEMIQFSGVANHNKKEVYEHKFTNHTFETTVIYKERTVNGSVILSDTLGLGGMYEGIITLNVYPNDRLRD